MLFFSDSEEPTKYFSSYDPSGEHAWIYSENIEISSQGENKTYKIPYNEKIGKWKLIARDSATGLTIEKEFEIV